MQQRVKFPVHGWDKCVEKKSNDEIVTLCVVRKTSLNVICM